jgi:hypothetical protein
MQGNISKFKDKSPRWGPFHLGWPCQSYTSILTDWRLRWRLPVRLSVEIEVKMNRSEPCDYRRLGAKNIPSERSFLKARGGGGVKFLVHPASLGPKRQCDSLRGEFQRRIGRKLPENSSHGRSRGPLGEQNIDSARSLGKGDGRP